MTVCEPKKLMDEIDKAIPKDCIQELNTIYNMSRQAISGQYKLINGQGKRHLTQTPPT